MVVESEVPLSAPRPGSIFADRYRIDRVLGVGGMGFVLAATHLQSQERVAIKMLLPALLSDAQLVERFVREGRAAIKIKSEHIARVIEVAELPDRTPYLVMEHLDGEDLGEIIRSRGKVPFDKAVDWVLEACEAIAEAHALKIVHRDLKPANMFLARRSSSGDATGAAAGEIVKVLDFGISKTTGVDGNLAMTKTSAMLGSPLYMSPEQLKSARNVDERSDIWSIGIILYELIVGRPPFFAETLAELGALVLSGETPRLIDAAVAAAHDVVPQQLSEVVGTCLQRKPEDRFVNLADFAEAIAPYGGPGALASARTIAMTLGGIPELRATITEHVPTGGATPISGPSISTRGGTKVLRGDRDSSADSQMPGGPSSSSRMPAYGVTASATRKSSTVVPSVAVALLVLGIVGGVLIYRARASSHLAATEAPIPTTSSSSASATASGSATASATSSPVADTTSIGLPTASTASAVASVEAKAAAKPPRSRPHGTTPPTTTTTIAAPPSAAAPKPSSASGIATSSKD